MSLRPARTNSTSTSGAIPPVAVVDYGLGNLFSIDRALQHVGSWAEVTSSAEVLKRSAALILPGVGAFGDGMQQLRLRGLIDPILEFVGSGRPALGICLGMQLLFSESEEFGQYDGLGLIPGKVARLQDLDPSGRRVKLPHIGWSDIYRTRPKDSRHSAILDGVKDGDAMYFVHSYVPFPETDSVCVATASYGGHPYCVVAEQGNVTGVQFHPEKSGEVGLQLLRNFVEKIRNQGGAQPCPPENR